MLVLLSICRPAIGQILTILASDWSKQIKILLILIRHLRGLRGFNLTFPTFYRVSSPAQRNLESHKNARYDSCMSVPMPRRRWKVWLTNWRCSQPTRIFPDLLDMTYFIVSCHFSLLRHHFLSLTWTENVTRKESWAADLIACFIKDQPLEEDQISKPAKISSYNLQCLFSDRIPI